MLYSIFRFLFALFFKIYLRLEVKGKENIPKKGSFILAGNHLSNLDPIVLGVASPRKLNYMAKESLFVNPLFSKALRIVGVFPIKRNSLDLSALKTAINKLASGVPLLIFPEGTRTAAGVQRSIQPGIGFLAVKSKVRVIPSFVQGTDLAMPRGAKFIRPRKVRVYFGKEITLERSKSHNYQDIANMIMRSVGHLDARNNQ